MNKPPIDRLQYRICFEEVTPESAADGEHSDSGVEHECWTCDTFDEVVSLVRNHGAEGWSSQPHRKGDHGWLSSGWETDDSWTMTERQTTIHALNERSLKYLEKAYTHFDNWRKA